MKILKIAALSAASAIGLVACGGGGGSPGDTNTGYEITLRAERTQLPLNIDNVGPGIGVSAPYTTVLYVRATKNGTPIPGGEDIFGCTIAYGLSSGSLYYLDGKDEHMHEVKLPDGSTVKVPSPFRTIDLGANAGGNSFHFHAGDQAGTATIVCAVGDPSDKSNPSASIDITVGAATGRAASIRGVALTPVLTTQGNAINGATSTAIQARVLDDANQPVDGANMQVEIMGGSGAVGARLLAGPQSGGVVQVGTTAGVGLFSLSSGTQQGSIVLRLTTDRADGNVANGIQDPIVQTLVVIVSNQIATDPVTIAAATLPDAPYGVPYAYAFSASGGLAPYTWSVSGSLPAGMAMSSDGVLSGTPSGGMGGQFNFVVRVTDSQGKSASANVALKVGDPPVVPKLAIGGCTPGATCTLPPAEAGSSYSYTFFTTGGSGGTKTWQLMGSASGVTLDAATGKLDWAAPACPAAPAGTAPGPTVLVRVVAGSDIAEQSVKIPVTQAGGAACP
ncbi:Ig domain-containing protein [Comamonas sp. NLF-1-9]|uniref:Ig domain-containing protein n=1 Tax=Comamonas sp. NLF-1-9 TaxID=2853163 RepID=UPI001C486A78|nr:Ig domain-containing protein [Comamonas sp. NLF-1-9]QXL85749.1 Ig domain-containing protein [Comamonas sp. NLF-1-9]